MPTFDLRGRDFITTRDFNREELEYLINSAIDIKRMYYSGLRKTLADTLWGRRVALLFKKPSTRTRNSLQAAAHILGAFSVYMRPDEMQLARGEPIKDTARVLDRYFDALIIRTFEQSEVEEYARYMRNPVINALTDLEHPLQILADLMTIKEKFGHWDGLKAVYTGDVWNVAHSIIATFPMFGIDVTLAIPKGYDPNPEIYKFGEEMSKKKGTKLEIIHDLKEAVRGADIVIANTWWSMGKPETEKDKRKVDFKPFTVTREIMSLAKENAIFMHCLPAYRGNEVTEEVIEGPQSVVFDEAENRLWTAASVMAAVIL